MNNLISIEDKLPDIQDIQWEYSKDWSGPIRYDPNRGEITKYKGHDALSVRKKHTKDSSFSKQSFLTRTFDKCNGLEVPILLNPFNKCLLPLNTVFGIHPAYALSCDYISLNGKVAVVYNPIDKITYMVNTIPVKYTDRIENQVYIYALDLEYRSLKLKRSFSYETGLYTLSLSVYLDEDGKLIIVDRTLKEELQFKFVRVGPSLEYYKINTSVLRTHFAFMSHINGCFRIYNNIENWIAPSEPKNYHIYFRDITKVGNIVFAYSSNNNNNIILITGRNKFFNHCLITGKITPISGQIKKSINLFRELQKSFGGIDALIKSNKYNVSIHKRDIKFFINLFNLPDDWDREINLIPEESSRREIEIETKSFAEGKNIALTFLFNEDLKRDFIMTRKVWDRAFIKKINKKKLLKNYPIFSALVKSKMG